MTTKKCIDCQLIKQLTCYPLRLDSKDGYNNKCQSCIDIYQENYRKLNRKQRVLDQKLYAAKNTLEAKALVSSIKNNSVCIDCHLPYPEYMLDFDHLDPAQKTFTITYAVGKGMHLSKIRNEINKCVLRCANCHRNKTYLQHHQRKEGSSTTTQLRHSKADFVNNLKRNPCFDCKKSFNYWQMDFDHRDPTNKFMSISEMIRRHFSNKIILKEIEKCDLVCVNCHRQRTWGK